MRSNLPDCLLDERSYARVLHLVAEVVHFLGCRGAVSVARRGCAGVERHEEAGVQEVVRVAQSRIRVFLLA